MEDKIKELREVALKRYVEQLKLLRKMIESELQDIELDGTENISRSINYTLTEAAKYNYEIQLLNKLER